MNTSSTYKKLIVSILFTILALSGISYGQTVQDTSYLRKFLPDSLMNDSSNRDLNLCTAAFDGNDSLVLRLLNKGANMEFSTDGNIALHYAVINGHLNVVRILVLNGCDINRPTFESETPLMLSVRNGYDDITDFLCQKGASVDSSDYERRTPLMFAAADGKITQADILLFYGANINLKDFDGNDAFLLACFANQLEMASFLHHKGANINTRDDYNNTPLIIASEKSYYELCDSLLTWGADAKLKNKSGYTALAKAIEMNSAPIVKKLSTNKDLLNEDIRTGIKPLDLARNKPGIDSLLKASGAHPSSFPDYSELLFGFNFSSNFKDYMNDFHIGVFDPKFLTSINIGFHARMAALKTYVPKSADTWYQYRERRYFIWAGIDKQIAIFHFGEFKKAGILPGLKFGYTFGNYRGSSSPAAASWLFVPGIQLFYSSRYFTSGIGYEYAKYPCYQLAPGHMTASIIFHFPYRNEDLNIKNVYWIQPEE